MARGKRQGFPQVEEMRSYVEGVAKNLVEKLYGPQGPAWGTKLTQIEDVFLEIREMLTEKMLDVTLAKQAAAGERPEAFRSCPGCHAPLPCARGQSPHPQDAGGRGRMARAGRLLRPLPAGFFSLSPRAWGLIRPKPVPGLLAKITYAGTASRSFAEGSVLLDKLADWPVPEKP